MHKMVDEAQTPIHVGTEKLHYYHTMDSHQREKQMSVERFDTTYTYIHTQIAHNKTHTLSHT